MSKISILDLATLNQADSFLTELSETELQISGGGHHHGHGGSGKKNSRKKNSGKRGGSGKKSSRKKSSGCGHNCHPCW
jgi:hypothetical protein